MPTMVSIMTAGVSILAGNSTLHIYTTCRESHLFISTPCAGNPTSSYLYHVQGTPHLCRVLSPQFLHCCFIMAETCRTQYRHTCSLYDEWGPEPIYYLTPWIMTGFYTVDWYSYFQLNWHFLGIQLQLIKSKDLTRYCWLITGVQ